MTAIMEALGPEFNSQFDDFFAIDNTIVLRNCDYEDEDIKEYYDSLNEKGDFNKWMGLVKELRKNKFS